MVARFGGTLVLSLIASLIILTAIAVVSYRSVRTLTANNELVNHTQEVLEQLQDIRIHLIQVETDARGFLLTGDTVYRDAYERGLQEIPQKIAAVKADTLDNPSHQQKFPVLDAAVKSRLDLLDEYVKRREVLGATVIPQGQSGEGKKRMDAVRTALEEISNDERSLLSARLDESRRNTNQLQITLALSYVGAFGLICIVFYLARRDLRAREINEANLRAARDLLEQRVAERTVELNDLNLELERSNRELQDFAFVASHDLQEPLRKIQAFGDRLKQVQGPKFDDKGRDYLERMNRAAGRMHTLINDLLTFSRVATKAKPFVQTDLNEVIRGVLDDLEERIRQTGATVDVSDLPVIDADELQMRQLFQNLIGNALKFQQPDRTPVVKVEAGPKAIDGTFRISVADNGIGFDEKYLDRIFTPFQRLHARNEYEGTGIGLAVCRKIVERHGGTLTAESTPGTGSTFLITLPMTQDKENFQDEE